MAVLIAAAVLSLSAQVAEATPGLHRLAGRRRPRPGLPGPVQTRPVPHCHYQGRPVTCPGHRTAHHPARRSIHRQSRLAEPDTEPPAHLLTSARMAAFAHHQATGQTITADGLADHLGLSPALAGTLLHHLDGTTAPPVTNLNGSPITGAARD